MPPAASKNRPTSCALRHWDRPLTKEEAVRVLIHLAQRRGYKSNSTAEAAKDEKETGKVKTAIEENRRCHGRARLPHGRRDDVSG